MWCRVHSCGSPGHASVGAAQDSLIFLCCQGVLLANVQLVSTTTARIFSAELFLWWSGPSPYHCRGLLLSKHRTCVFSRWGTSLRFLLPIPSSFLLWMSILPSSVSTDPANWCQLQTWWECTPSTTSGSFIKLLSKTGPRIKSCTCHWPPGRERHINYHPLSSTTFGVFFIQLDFFLICIHPSRL